MTITSLDPIACTEQTAPVDTPEESISWRALPKLVWVGGALFVTNLLFGLGMLITPNLETDPFGAEVRSYDVATGKISPFTEVVDTKKRPVRLAAKAHPVTFVPTEEDLSTYASLEVPTSTARINELELKRTSARELNIPRSSVRPAYQELDIPVRTENAVYQPGGSDIAPRVKSEREKNSVVIN